METINILRVVRNFCYTLLAVWLISCSVTIQPNLQVPTKTKWRISRIEIYKNGCCYYRAEPLNFVTDGFIIDETWFVDTVGLYDVGDTISFYPCK